MCLHAHIHAYIHAHTLGCTHMYTNTHAYILTHVYVHTHIHPHNYPSVESEGDFSLSLLPPWTLGIKLRSSSFHCKYIHPMNSLDSTYGLDSEKKSKRRKISDDSIQIWPTVFSSYLNTHTHTCTNTHTCTHTHNSPNIAYSESSGNFDTNVLFFSYNNLSKVYSSSLSPKNLSIYSNSQPFIYLQNSMGQSNLVWQLIAFWTNVM